MKRSVEVRHEDKFYKKNFLRMFNFPLLDKMDFG